MDAITPFAIRKQRMNKREEEHTSRERLGFHVFISRFFFDFKKLSLAQKHLYLFKQDGLLQGMYTAIGDDESIDSTDSLLTDPISRVVIYRSACLEWKYHTSAQQKKAWTTRAKFLNNRKLPGKFMQVPWTGHTNSVEDRLLQSLSFEWNLVVKFFKNCITRDPRKAVRSMIYTFGKEKVHILSQTYREYTMSYLMETTIFGHNLCLLKKKEIISKTKNQALIHISNQKRMKLIFSKESLNATEHFVEKYDVSFTHTCCAKVNILYKGKNIIGYILDESRGKWKILLGNNKIIYKNIVKYNNSIYGYEYESSGVYKINFYWPIRILLRCNGKGMRITLNRVAFIRKGHDKYELVDRHCS